MGSGPSIDYATAGTPRPRRGGYAVLHEPGGLRIVHGPTGWGWRQWLIVVALAGLPIAAFAMATGAIHSRRPGSGWFALVVIAVGIVLSIVAVVGFLYVYHASKRVTELCVGRSQVTRTVSDSQKMDLWPRESVAGFTVMLNHRNQYSALCLSTHDHDNPVLINWLTQADAHALAAAGNAELAKPPLADPAGEPDLSAHIPPDRS